MTGDEARDAVLRAVAVIGLAGVALIHLLDTHDTFARPPPHVVVHRSRAGP